MTARLLAPAQTLPWVRWYGLASWKARRAHQLAKEPLCAECLKRGQVTPATVADHEPPHGGNWNAFRTGPLQSLCAECHNAKQAIKHKGYRSDLIDDNGYPMDGNHPFNRVR